MPLLFTVPLFSTFHAGTGGINKVFGVLIMLNFQSRISNYLFVVSARNSLAMSSDSESEMFITQSSFRGGTAIELSENNLESLLVAGADNEQAPKSGIVKTVCNICNCRSG